MNIKANNENPTGKKSNYELLYLLYFAYSIMYRTYISASVLAMSKIKDSSVVAIAGFLISFTIFISSTYIGSLIDKINRILAMKIIVVSEICSVSCEYTLSNIILNDQNTEFRILILTVLPILSALSGKTYRII